MINYAQFQFLNAYLSTDFGRDLACKKLGLTPEELAAKVGRYVRGKRKGMLKGQLQWVKVIKGGWVKTGAYDFDVMQGNGFVAKPGISFAYVVRDTWSGDLLIGSDKAILNQDGQVLIEESYLNEVKR